MDNLYWLSIFYALYRYLLLYDNNNFNNNITNMSLYLKKFENHTQYNTYTASTEFIMPNVSICTTEGDVHYNPYVDPYNGHEYVDLGLPSGTLWATMNVGATGMTDYGNYYQYGKGDAQYAATSGQSDYTGTENPLALSADTAVQVWGGQWHMPTRAQFNELTANTYYRWVTNYQGSGKKGATYTANGQTLFIPAAGYYNNGNLYGVDNFGSAWSSTPSSVSYVYRLFFNDNGGKDVNCAAGNVGYSIRPVVG